MSSALLLFEPGSQIAFASDASNRPQARTFPGTKQKFCRTEKEPFSMFKYSLPIEKMPYEDNTYKTPELDYSTPEKNLPGKWAINSDMVQVD
jgi:hypothetical protein